MIKKKCLQCKKMTVFRGAPSDPSMYCSRECYHKSMDRKVSNVCKICGENYLVHRFRAKTSIVCSMKCRNLHYRTLKGEKSSGWKGEKASYYAIHMYMRSEYGKPTSCEWCGKKASKNKGNRNTIQWANLDYKYGRNRSDWATLCKDCHYKYDSKNGWGLGTKFIKKQEKLLNAS